ncbi:sensor histidine kinase [Nocardiopsis sp. RSe5-2]|uniref:histidine kinase n=1 Tax=Nocardiopsis endophytica TaxID=3018445 RepID=A0ABT4UB13_9ACTN|nr:sensor histidine kinase [Nocardiopsis endophytica]MDA2813664.1 sensor histidine kinase [Nocardiopsis endophytica]
MLGANGRIRPPDWAADLILGALLGAPLVTVTVLVAHGGPSGGLPPGGIALIAAACLSLALRRVSPVLCTALTGAISIAYYALLFPDGPMLIAFLAALSTAVAFGHRTAALALGATTLGAMELTEYLLRDGFWPDPVPLFGKLVSLLLAVAAGEASRARRAYVDEAEHRAREAERTRDLVARNLVAEERLRIARELHDTLAHSLSLINVQAKGGLHQGTHEGAVTALTHIKDASREAIGEVRRTVGEMRRGAAGQEEEPPTADRVAALVDDVRRSGLEVGLSSEGDLAQAPPDTAHAAFRILQEALTNALRHSGGSTVRIRLRCGDGGIALDVEDDGVGPAGGPPGGNGLKGMRERAHTVGGTVDVGRSPDGGFRVTARLPAAPPEPPPEPPAGERVEADR